MTSPFLMRVDRVVGPFRDTAAFLLVLLASLAYLSAHFPSLDDYRLAADEGMYYRQASTIATEGLGGFVTLADAYIAPGLVFAPLPLRIGHILPAAAFVRAHRSIVALSVLSLVCYGLLCLSVFWFVGRIWDPRTGLIAGVLVCVSPLGGALARRALMDTDFALFSALSVFMLLTWLKTERERHFAIFAGSLVWSLLVKETAFFYLPFFVGTLIALKATGRAAVGSRHIVIVALAVPAAVALVYVVLAGGFGRLLQVVDVARRSNVTNPNAYTAAYSSGPWYEYFVDYLLLSPLVLIFFFLFCGRHLSASRRDVATTVVLLFFCHVVVCLSFLPKNPRYALPLDAILRLGAAAMIGALAGQVRAGPAARAAITAGLVALMAVSDVRAFQRYFVLEGIYDPVAFNLLSAEKFIPPWPGGPSSPRDLTPKVTTGGETSAEEYLRRSLVFYRARDFESCIRMCHMALAIKPDYAEAYNNLGAAYCELGDWAAAIPALEEALRLRPDYLLASNNLAWARAQRPR